MNQVFFFPHIKFGLILKNCLVYVFFLLIWELGLESKRIGSIRGELKFEFIFVHNFDEYLVIYLSLFVNCDCDLNFCYAR